MLQIKITYPLRKNGLARIGENNGTSKFLDKEVVLMGEEILLQIMPYRKQADIWAVESKRYEGNYKSFDARIKTFTTMIPIVE